jgi:hypothetical protein
VEYRNFRANGERLSMRHRTSTEGEMLHDQVITYLEATIIFLLLTNAVSVAAAAYVISVASGLNPRWRAAKAVVASTPNAVLTATWPSSGR